MVVVRHQTEIGEGTNGLVTFFSIYMHLREVEPTVRQGQRIYRKSPIGRAGQIYGQTGRIHFESVCDDANVTRLIGRAKGALPTESNGRTDAVFGEVYFHLPQGTQVFAERPMPGNPTAHRQPPRPPGASRNSPLPAPVALQAAHTLAASLVVGLHYSAGDGPVGSKGDLVVTSYRNDGTTIGDPLRETEVEYRLIASANEICATYPATRRPVASAVYELLRFGRVVGVDELNPGDVPHWRQVRYAEDGIGWVNLNATGVTRFSDADAPHWRNWSLVDDGADQDSRCDSATIRNWLDANSDGSVAPNEALARMAMPSVAAKLERAVCKFPTEWSASRFDDRLGWLQSPSLENPTPLNPTSFERLRAHVDALAFWPASTDLAETCWHWSPRAFIAHFRQCGWLSANEMAQCFPRHIQHLTGTRFEQSTFTWANAIARSTTWSLHFNRANRKYGTDPRQRLVHFFAQVVPETGFLRLMKESDNRDGSYLRGKPYYPYYGRGLIQLTWADNYRRYGEFRGFPRTEGPGSAFHEAGWNPDVLLVESNTIYNASNCADSAGYYVAAHASMKQGMDGGIAVDDGIAVSRCVNGNVAVQNINGLDGRLQSILCIRDVLLDLPAEAAGETLRFTWRRNSALEDTGRVGSNGRPIRAYIPREWELEVSLAKQRP